MIEFSSQAFIAPAKPMILLKDGAPALIYFFLLKYPDLILHKTINIFRNRSFKIETQKLCAAKQQ